MGLALNHKDYRVIGTDRNGSIFTICDYASYQDIPNRLVDRIKQPVSGYQYMGEIDGKPIELSRFDDTGKLIWHTEFENIEPIMNHVKNNLWKEALEEKDYDKLMQKLGEIFWWVCQAKPWSLGDPSIAEMLIKSVLASKGFSSLAWKEGITPWVEVMVEPGVNEFSKNFATLFDTGSIPTKNS